MHSNDITRSSSYEIQLLSCDALHPLERVHPDLLDLLREFVDDLRQLVILGDRQLLDAKRLDQVRSSLGTSNCVPINVPPSGASPYAWLLPGAQMQMMQRQP